MIDLRSDTVTKPTAAMREAMMQAEVGDDVMGEDPTVIALENRVAALFGKEAGLFTCSATQANQIAIRIHTSPGDELLINSKGHIGLYEAGGPAVLSGVTVKQIASPRGMLEPEDIVGHCQPDDPHYTRTRLVCVENTTNIGGGYVYPLNQLEAITRTAKEKELLCHLDGARIFNAIVSGGYSPAEAAAGFDTVSICFSKGMGCPVGAILVGSKSAIHQGRRIRKMFGGGMRQAGILAGAALFALDHNVERLRDDHQSAKQLADGLDSLKGITVSNHPIESNIVFFDLEAELGSANSFTKSLEKHGVKIGSLGNQQLRAVTHLDVSTPDMAERVLSAVEKTLLS